MVTHGQLTGDFCPKGNDNVRCADMFCIKYTDYWSWMDYDKLLFNRTN